MDAAALKEIERIITSANSEIVECDAEPGGVYYVRQGDKLERVEAKPGPVKHIAQELKTIADFANRHKTTATLWVATGMDGANAKCLMADKPEGDQACIFLKHSDPFAELTKLQSNWQKMPFKQHDLVLSLRTTFANAIDAKTDLLGCVRSVRFRTQAESSGVIEKGRASVGKSIEQQVSGAREIPEEVVFSVPVYASGHMVYVSVRVAIEVDMGKEQFFLIPLPGEIEKALATARLSIASWVVNQLEEDSPVRDKVYFGAP
jgi:hypothetical protein